MVDLDVINFSKFKRRSCHQPLTRVELEQTILERTDLNDKTVSKYTRLNERICSISYL